MITLIAGPMKSGKSTELFRQMERKHIAGKKVLYIGPNLDTRDFFARGIPRSKLFEVANCESVKDWELIDSEIINKWVNSYDAIFIDEFFMIKNNLKICTTLPTAGHKCDIYFGGLIANANATSWPEFSAIAPYCDEFIKLSAVCEKCGSEHANYSAFMGEIKDGEIVIGDVQYSALCRKCFLEHIRGIKNGN